MRGIAVCAASLVLTATTAFAGSFPTGVTYPLKSATLQPSGLAQPLPSTRRYVLVWKDQLIPDGYSDALKTWVVTHYVGTQKLFKRQIDDYRTRNANFLMLVYHLAYGLNGADQTNPVGNITGIDKFGQEDTDTFTPYVALSGITRENAYQHYDTPASTSTRVSYPDPYWLMDVSSTEWQSYLTATLLEWQAYPSKNATGVFFDVAFPPWYNYSPANWWTKPAGGSPRVDLDNWWSPRAGKYFDALRTAFAPTGAHPRYIIIPNTDALVDGTDEPAFLDSTDGVFTENWQAVTAGGPGDWNLTVRRICRYVTGRAKVWSTDITKDGTTLSQQERELIIGTYLLIRNGTSYIMIGGGDLSWYPEYEIDVGGYVDEPPDDIEKLRVAGTGGSSGGLYVRPYVAGTVIVNSSAGSLSYNVPSPMKRAAFSGGGAVAADGTEASQTLTYTTDVPAGPLAVGAMSVVILQSPNGPPPPGQEPGDTGGDGGTRAEDGGGVDSGNDEAGIGPPGANPADASSGCGCVTEGRPGGPAAGMIGIGLALLGLARRRKLGQQ